MHMVTMTITLTLTPLVHIMMPYADVHYMAIHSACSVCMDTAICLCPSLMQY